MMKKLGYRNKVLITGSGGFISSHLRPLLKEYTVRGWDLKDGQDIFDESFEKEMKWADVVYHLAAETSVNQSFNRVQDFIFTNVLGTARVLQLAVKYKVKVIFASSGAVYNRKLSPYAESKALADDLCTSLQPYYPITILRFFNIFGTNMNENTGSIIWNFLQGQKKGEIVVYGSGEQTRDFINVKDIAAVLKAAIGKKWDGKTVDVGTGQTYTINYIAELFAHFGNGSIIYTDPPKREIKWSDADLNMLKTLYKKKLVTNVEKDIKEIVKYYETH
jgi:UDP-glucose 4-epimerase